MDLSNQIAQTVNIFDMNDLQSPNKSEKTKKVASEFAAIFVNEMLKSARKTQFMKNEFFDSNQVKMANGLYDQEMSLEMTKDSSLGISNLIEAQIKSEEQ